MFHLYKSMSRGLHSAFALLLMFIKAVQANNIKHTRRAILVTPAVNLEIAFVNLYEAKD